MRSRLRAIGAIVLSLVALTTPALAATPTPTPSPSSTGQPPLNDPNLVTFGVQPAGPNGPDQRNWLYYSVTPGATLSDWVAIQNYSTKPISVTVYPADASTNDTGQFTLAQQNQQMRDAGSWITLDLKNPQVTVPPRNSGGAGHVLIQLHMKVPANASPGDHGAGVIASLVGFGKNAQGLTIKFYQRIATRVYVRVSGKLSPGLEILNLKASYIGTLNPFGLGKVRLSYTVRNTGNLKLGARQLIHIQGWLPFGLDYKGLPDIPLMLPGGEAQVSTVISGVFPAIREGVTVRLTALQLQSDLNPYLPDVKSTVHVWAWPWPLLVLILVVGFLIRRLIKRLRRPSRARRARTRDSGTAEPIAASQVQ